jgi:hypothetical protein
MAQAGFTPIQLYYSNTTTNVPAALVNGELAINQADGKLYYRNNSGVVTQFTSGGSGTVTSVAFSAGTTPYQEVYQLVDMMQKVIADQQQQPKNDVQVETLGENND